MRRDAQHGPGSGLSTRAVHAGEATPRGGAPVVSPIVQSSTFYTADEPGAEVRYTRYGNNPNQQVTADKLAAMEGAEAGIIVGSGMAATALSLLTFLSTGDHVVAASSLYGGTLQLLRRELPRLGIEATFVPQGGRWASAMRKRTRVLLVELPSNPTLRVMRLEPLSKIARERGVALVVDATFATPVNLRPLEHGADVVVHSATKYLGGHSDLVAGAVAGPASVIDEVRERMKSFGASLDPNAAWLLERGMKTLSLRVERQNRNALALAGWLESLPSVSRVLHPGLASHPDHEVASDMMDGFGGMLSLVVRGGDRRAGQVMNRFRLIRVAPSLGGVESLASMPRHTSHAGMDAAERKEAGIEPGFIRLSIGIEDEADLRADLEQALESSA